MYRSGIASAPVSYTHLDVYKRQVLYLLKSGCQWRMLPDRFPNWVTVYSYFAKWSATDQDGTSALAVSYTHLDVYKRQVLIRALMI